MGYFDNLKAINIFRESKPFDGLNTIKWRAEAILAGNTLDDLDRTAEQLEATSKNPCRVRDEIGKILIPT